MGQIVGRGSGLEEAVHRACDRAGRLGVTGRYHQAPQRFFDEDYVLVGKVLGQGYNGKVRLAKSRATGRHFAVKDFKLLGTSRQQRRMLEREAEIFLGMDHPHVARLVDVYETDETMSLVMEQLTGGELFDRVAERMRYSEKDAAGAVWQMLLAVNYIHSHGIVHRDIKLENFMYESKGSDVLKLIDFGFSKVWRPNTKMGLSCGTLGYMAPEVLRKAYDSQCDMWSLGVVVYILLFGRMPFRGSEEQQLTSMQLGLYKMPSEAARNLSPLALDFVRSLLVVDPEVRLTAAQALEHRWLVERKAGSSREIGRDTVQALCSFGQASAFRRACMLMMAWSTTSAERSRMTEAFLRMDRSQRGTVRLCEFKEAVLREVQLTDARVEEAFRALDVTSSEEIHYSEFLAAMMCSRVALHDELLQRTFRRFDADNSGSISVQELRRVLGETFAGAEVEEIMREVGHNGEISYTDWIAYLRGGTGAVAAAHVEAASFVIDTQLDKKQRVPSSCRLQTLDSFLVPDSVSPVA